MPDYVNSNNYDLHLVGPDGKKITIRRGNNIHLPQFFDRYVKRGFLKHIRTPQRQTALSETTRSKKYKLSRNLVLGAAKKQIRKTIIRHRSSHTSTKDAGRAADPLANFPADPPANLPTDRAKAIIRHRASVASTKMASHTIRRLNKSRAKQQLTSRMIGRGFKEGATESLHKTLSTTIYPISNGIGVGILSFNRPRSLRRLINSIIRLTDLSRTTVFISDDGSTDAELHRYLDKLEKTNNFVIIENETRLGIAGNSNRLLRCLDRFQHKLLLNDDVEVLNKGWEHVYFRAMKSTRMHHFCLNQPGVYGAPEGIKQPMGNKILVRIDERPHGAVMAFDDTVFSRIGYFDESFGYYGMEHVDWSSRVAAAKLQPPGYWDIDDADRYFKIYSDRSAVPDRVKHLQIARAKYTGMSGRNTKIKASDRSIVPSISCIIPFKDIGRHQPINTAINNIRAQRFPVIDMIAVEQDDQSHFSEDELCCVQHVLVRTPGRPFNKSMAFNAGVSRAKSDKLLLHDADTLAPAHYAQMVSNALDRSESCHFGARVIYADKKSTDIIGKNGRIDRTVSADKIVTYFEGGSIACLTDTYWRVGGFVEGYWGYGCFAPGNYVLTRNGYKDIVDVVDGELLYTHEARFQPAVTRERFYRGELLDIYVTGRLGVKGVTPEHPFMVRDGETFVWKMAKDIIEGDELLDTDFMPEALSSYNLADILRADNSNYYNAHVSEKRHTYSTSSINLAMLTSGVMRNACAAHSFYSRPGGLFEGSVDRVFDICINKESKHLVKTEPPLIGSSSMGRSTFGRVNSIKSRRYAGMVYNFEVADDHSYVVNGLAVHNCEDCDFYFRLSKGSRWFENRIIDFIHLWHDRTSGWVKYHDANKEFEKTLASLSVKDRILKQHKYFSGTPYGKFIARALAKQDCTPNESSHL